ncbi:MAG: RNA polymerase sigma factor [Myxococcales bacterium]|nr:RNA polymerase sigma factor [Myxococcales bacterium]
MTRPDASASAASLPAFSAERAARRERAERVDHAAFIRRALSHADELLAYARRLCSSAADADDVLQETYLRALTRHRQLRELERCRPWLFRIARCVVIDGQRARARKPVVLVDDELLADRAACARGAARQLRPDLERALALLPQAQREALLLCDVWEFRYAEIVAVPVGTVRSRIARARAALAGALGGDEATR